VEIMGVSRRRVRNKVKVKEMEVVMIRREWYQLFKLGWFRFTDSWKRKWFVKLNE